MNRLALSLVAAIAAGAGGYCLGAQSRGADGALLEEQTAQRAQWNSIRKRLDELSLCGRAAASPSHPAAAAPPAPSANLDDVVERVLDAREKRAELEAEAEAAPSDDNYQAFAEGEQLLDAALTRGVWTETQRATFRDLLMRVSGEQAEELRRRLAVAVNEDQIAVHTGGPAI